ncbi:c-type cytochrome domain-containing protein [Mongoliibacter sp.]|uniref:c-type cytochrome domain-containing protein n=1 Tax=Mongoliibacter sp. TaxID=2022438 RepID=UPI0025F7832F|nr:c-type cytochrome domain-containing protein [Mongoliibacter sp.]
MSLKSRILLILDYFLIIMHSLIIVLIIGQGRMVFPPLLEVFGRMHPLLLHFPIVLLILTAFLFWFPDSIPYPAFRKNFLLFSLFFTGLTVIAGFLLSSESGYSYENIKFHQWTAVAVFWLGSIWYWAEKKDNFLTLKLLPTLTLLLIIVTGHLGASITHGDDFLLEPLKTAAKNPQVALEEADTYTHIIKPIMEQKCISCHKASKQKGDLRLDEAKFILAGGKSGLSIDPTDPKESLIFKRIHLPLEDEEHMPPKGKIQLDEEEKQLLSAWILESAHFDKKVTAFDAEDKFFSLAKNWVESRQKVNYDFEAADPKKIKSLNDEYRLVEPIAPQSPALAVRFFGKKEFNPARLVELKKIDEQIVSLNLSHMDLNDEDIKVIGGFKNLENLNLNFTGISGQALEPLTKLRKLKNLSLSGNPIQSEGLDIIQKIPAIKTVYLWNTQIEEKEIENFIAKNSQIKIETGHRNEGEAIALNSPFIEFDNVIFEESEKITLRHPIGSVRIRYTLDGTEPDSLSMEYKEPIILKESTEIRAKAFASGWLESPSAKKLVFMAGIKPVKYNLVYEPNEQYKGKGVETLFDLVKGDEDFGSGKWLGFQQNPFEAILKFDANQTVNNISLSLLTDEGSHIFPPYRIEIFKRNSSGQWENIFQEKPEQPLENYGKQMILKNISLKNENVISSLKIKLSPVSALPNWHPSKGSQAWVFIDEILIN